MPGKIEQVHENLFNVGANVRIERGPRLIRAKATRELLSDESTAVHYHLPRSYRADDGSVVTVTARDAEGNLIREGREVALLHWNEPTDMRPWYVYRLEVEQPREVPRGHDDAGNPERDKNGNIVMIRDPNHWVEMAVIDSFDAAVAAAQEMADDGAKPLRGHMRASPPRSASPPSSSRH